MAEHGDERVPRRAGRRGTETRERKEHVDLARLSARGLGAPAPPSTDSGSANWTRCSAGHIRPIPRAIRLELPRKLSRRHDARTCTGLTEQQTSLLGPRGRDGLGRGTHARAPRPICAFAGSRRAVRGHLTGVEARSEKIPTPDGRSTTGTRPAELVDDRARLRWRSSSAAARRCASSISRGATRRDPRACSRPQYHGLGQTMQEAMVREVATSPQTGGRLRGRARRRRQDDGDARSLAQMRSRREPGCRRHRRGAVGRRRGEAPGRDRYPGHDPSSGSSMMRAVTGAFLPRSLLGRRRRGRDGRDPRARASSVLDLVERAERKALLIGASASAPSGWRRRPLLRRHRRASRRHWAATENRRQHRRSRARSPRSMSGAGVGRDYLAYAEKRE